MTRERLYLVLLVGWVALTFTLTSIPNPEFGPSFPGVDKVAHFGFYGVAGFLCALWRLELGKERLASVICAVAFIALLGAVDEFHQQWIPGRSMELLDWMADLAGGAAGALCSNVAVNLFPFLLTSEHSPAPRTASN